MDPMASKRRHGGKGAQATGVRRFIAMRLRQVCKEDGISGIKASAATGVSRWAWKRYMAGDVTVPSEVLFMFATAFHRSTVDFYPRRDFMHDSVEPPLAAAA